MREIPKLKLDLNKPEEFGNLANRLADDERRTVANDIIELVAVDESSMSDWLGKAEGFMRKVKDEGRQEPQNREQEGAGEGPPPATEMTLSSVIQFSARATAAILGEPDLAKASEPGGEQLAAWVSSQLRTEDPNWTLDTDPLVIHMAVTGLGWRKRNYDDMDKAFESHFLTCKDVIVNSNIRSIERAPRVTHQFERYPYEIKRSIERKKWIDYHPRFDGADNQAPKKFYEVDLWLDLDDDGIEEPWTVVISRDDIAEIVRIRPRWSRKTVVDTDDALFFNAVRRFYPYRFLPDPEGGFFPIGFGELLNRVENSADQLLASITDTAKSESENGGVLAGGGFGLPDKIELKGNRVTTVNTDGAPLANRFSAFPSKSVSSGSVAVFEKLTALGDRLAGTLNVLDNAPASMSATMARGVIDNGHQIQGAVHRRLVASMTQEFRMFVQMADAYDALPQGAVAAGGKGVAVTADPQLATEMQRAALAGVYMEMIGQAAEGVPWNMKALQTRLAATLRLPNPEELLGSPSPPQATPWEKMQGAVALMKQQTEKIKVGGAVAVQLTQALKNIVDANGGMIDARMALLNIAQIENTVENLMKDAGNAGSFADGMAQQPGNASPPGLPPPAQDGGVGAIPGGVNGVPDATGDGGGVP